MNTTTHALQSEWIDAAKFEVLYSLSRRTYWQWIAEGKLTPYRPCKRKTLVKRSDVEKILEASRAGADLDAIVDETVAEVLGT
ncbi:MAG TPA: helix-turn-helix domain-containing protein [Candidatus Binatia bacterium]|jgi:excisionase family DNA binding protein|nr:helix-turn-helix domain-containing protein [Candidatus Binatia bacterium]